MKCVSVCCDRILSLQGASGRAGVTDLLTPCMDHGWCFGYTCQKRLSTFWAVASMGSTYAVNTTGTPPRHMRIWLPYAAEASELVLHINYFEPLGRYVWAPGVGRIEPSVIPAIGDASGHGAYFWDQVPPAWVAALQHAVAALLDRMTARGARTAASHTVTWRPRALPRSGGTACHKHL